MRAAVAAAVVLALAAACGDDPKQGGQAATPAPAPPPPAETHDAGMPFLPAWAAARVGDFTSWEVRVPGVEGLTVLTWRVIKVEGAGVRYAVNSRTTGEGGKILATADAEESHDALPIVFPPGATEETLTIAGKSIKTQKTVVRTAGSETTVWLSPQIPMSGVVKSSGPGGAEQTLVAWGRGGG